MRKLTVLLFTFLNTSCFCQSWCPAGATWYHTWSEPTTGKGYVKLLYTNDTLINGINCNKIKSEIHGVSWQGNINSTLGNYFTYLKNGVVYVNNDINSSVIFDTLFNFKANIGAVWRLSPSTSGACSNSTVTVTDTGSVLINNENLKWLKVNINTKWGNVSPYYNGPSFNDTIIERIGSLNTFYYNENLCPLGMDLGYSISLLGCYSDNSFGNYKHNFDLTCDYITGINERKSIEKYSCQYNYNTTNYEFKNVNANSIVIKIFDVTGKLLNSINTTSEITSLNTGEVKGFYFISVYKNNEIVFSGKLIQF